MKDNLLLFLLLFAFACENKPQTEAKERVNVTANTSIEKKLSVASTEDESQINSKGGEQTFQIQIGQVGEIRKGMAGKELYSIFDSTQVQKQRNTRNQYTYSIYQDSNNPVIVCTTANGDFIDEIIIQSAAYKTEKGIGVGNTFADLTKTYHVAKVQADKNRQIYVQVEELQKKQLGHNKEELVGIQFEIGLDASDLENGSVSASSIPPDARIVRILL